MRVSSPFHAHHFRLVLTNLGLAGSIGLCTAVLWFWGPPVLPLWYSLVTPAEQLAPHIMLLSLPALSGGLLLTTFWFGRKSSLEHEQYLATIGWWSGIALQAFLLLALLRIMKIIL